MVVNFNQIDPTQQGSSAQQNDKTGVAQELKKLDDLKSLQKQGDDRAYEALKSDAKQVQALRHEKAYQAKLQKDAGIKVLSDLANDLASLGIDVTPKASKTGGKLGEDLENIANKVLKEDKFEQNHMTQNAVKRSMTKQEQQKHESEEKERASNLISSGDVKEVIQDYSGAYAQNILAASPEARDRIEEARGKLKDKGFSDSDIAGVERAVKRSFGREFLTDIQESFINHMFSQKNTFDFVVTGRKLNQSYQQAVDAGPASGIKDDKESVKQTMDRVSENSREELKDFVRDAVESKLMERHIKGIDNRQEVKKLVELGNKVGFDFNGFLKTWEQKKVDMGLVIIEIQNVANAENKGEISIGEVKSGGVGDKHGYEMTKDEERELLVNQLRAEYLKQAMTGDPLANITFAPKIRKLKNGLIKLGLEMEDFSKVEKEARTLARYRTLEMVKDAFVERSTYYELSGPSYNLLNNKLKGLFANLDRLGMKLDKDQVDYIRDECNRLMHDHTIIELKSALALSDNGTASPTIEKNIPLMIKLVERLRSESGFSHGVGEDIDSIISDHNNGVRNLREDA